MADLEVPFVRDKELARQARERIEASIARLGGDSAAFWHAVALIYRRGLPDPGLGQVGSETVGSFVVPASADPPADEDDERRGDEHEVQPFPEQGGGEPDAQFTKLRAIAGVGLSLGHIGSYAGVLPTR